MMLVALIYSDNMWDVDDGGDGDAAGVGSDGSDVGANAADDVCNVGHR